MKTKFFRLLTILLFVLFILILSGFIFNQIRQINQKSRLSQIAALIGYYSENEIAQVNRCYDVFSHCGLFLYYETDITYEVFKTQLKQIQFEKTNETDIDGYEIFTDLNLGTKNKLSINEMDGMGDRNQLPRFIGYRWRFRDNEDHNWTVSYYPLSENSETIKLDGQPFKTNIVGILYQTK